MSQDIQTIEKTLSLGHGVKVLAAHPCGLLALEKPADIMSHPNKEFDRSRSLIRGEYDFNERRFYNLEDAGSVNEVYLVHRLDSATSGVILVCLDGALMPQIIRAFERNQVTKIYNAIVRGRPAGAPRQWTDNLMRVEGNRRGVRMKTGGNQVARTEQRVLRNDANQLGLSLIQLRPITGRTHQLRVQCTQRGHPILGDGNYGNFGFNRHFNSLTFARRMFLHAVSIELSLLVDGQKISFETKSELPVAFDKILESNKEARALSRYAVNRSDVSAAQRQRFGRVTPRF